MSDEIDAAQKGSASGKPLGTGDRSRSGARWVTAVTISNTLANAVQALIATVFMSPADYGLFLLAALAMNLGRQATEFSLGTGVIHRQGRGGALELDTVFWISMALGLTLYGIALGGVALFPVDRVDNRLPALILLVMVTVPLSASVAVHAAILERGLLFRRLCFGEIVGVFCGLAVMMTLTWAGYGPFALAWAMVTTVGVRAVWLWGALIGIWLPRVRFDREAARFHLAFGGYRVMTNATNFAVNRTDQILIAWAYGPEIVGLYGLAWMIIVDPILRLNGIANRLAMTVFARFQRFPRLCRSILRQTIRVLSSFTAPLIVGGAVVAPAFFDGFLRPEWREAVPMLQILSVAAIARSIANPAGAVVIAMGRASLAFKWTLAQLLLATGALVLAAVFLDPIGFTCVVVLTNVVMVFAIGPLLVRRVLPVATFFLIRAAMPAVFAAAAMGVCVFAVGLLVEGSVADLDQVVFAAQLITGIASYLVISHVFDRDRLHAALGALGPRRRR